MAPSIKTLHCINPACPQPYPQSGQSKFCGHCGAPLQLRQRYLPLQQLGSGGFATVYTVYDLTTESEQVLKVLLATEPKALSLFEQEAKVLARLRHPGVPKVEADGFFRITWRNPDRQVLYCLVMEKIPGQTLQEILEQQPQGCPEAWVLDWLAQAVEILGELHRHQIIHRDLKPSNLMVRQGTRQLVAIDFGGAKQIGPGPQAGSTRLVSPGYSPPEQIAGRMVTPTADFYALGRTCIHLLTGVSPADLEDPLTGELRWRDRGAVTPALADLLDELVQIDCRQRPASAIALQTRLHQIQIPPQSSSPLTTGFTAALTQQLTRQAQPLLKAGHLVVQQLRQGLSQTLTRLYRITIWIGQASFATGRGMLLGGLGGGLGAAMGFIGGFWLPLGPALADFFTQQLAGLLPDYALKFEPGMLLFALAGLGTAWGLTLAGGLGQRRCFWRAGGMGLIGYSLGGWGWQWLYPLLPEAGLASLSGIAIALLSLGLGFGRDQWIYTTVATLGILAAQGSLTVFYQWPPPAFWNFVGNSPDLPLLDTWPWLGLSLAWFGLWGSLLGLGLGISHYLLIPLLHWLGDRQNSQRFKP